MLIYIYTPLQVERLAALQRDLATAAARRDAEV